MKLKEIILKPELINWDILKNPEIAKPVYKLFKYYKDISHKFSIPSTDLYNNYQITDIIIDLHKIKHDALFIFSNTDQIIKVIDRLISYFEYNELS